MKKWFWVQLLLYVKTSHDYLKLKNSKLKKIYTCMRGDNAYVLVLQLISNIN